MINGMILTLEFKVTFKEQPGDIQQYKLFNTREAAIAFAILIEQAGGVAVYTSEYKNKLV